MTMKRRTIVIASVAMLISIPALFALREAITFHVNNRSNGFMVSAGRQREYLLHVPRSYDRSRPTPLVISLHGAGGWPVQQMELSLWNRLADEQGFIVVYPSGVVGLGPRVWGERDVRFIGELIDKLEATYNIDRSRIYANGLSNGGGMSFVLSCTMSDRIAAVGMVGAALILPWSWCTDHRPVPMIAFHGTADPMAPYKGGTSWVANGAFPAVPTFTAKWARRNRCGPEPIESSVAADVTRREYTNCADNAAVVLYTIEGGGHTWPGSEPMTEWFVGRTSRGVDATREMWAFFRAHPLPRPTLPARSEITLPRPRPRQWRAQPAQARVQAVPR
jgi:polyhydroxybutyrate depolymerase